MANPMQQTLENRWLEFASLCKSANSDELEMMRLTFYAGAASAWRMCAGGDALQLENDVMAFISVEQRDHDAEEASRG